MAELEHDLRALAVEIAWPDAPELAGPVARRLREAPRRASWRRPLVVAFAAALAALSVALAVPPARSALLDLLSIGGVTVERVATTPDAPRTGPALGRPVTVAEARASVRFVPAVPDVDLVRAFVDDSVPGGRVSFVWRERGRRLVLTQFAGRQVPVAEKLVGPGTRTVAVTVEGAEGVWLEGARHHVVWLDPSGEVRHETRRLAGNVLLWDRAGVTFRLEGARTLAHARAVVRSLP